MPRLARPQTARLRRLSSGQLIIEGQLEDEDPDEPFVVSENFESGLSRWTVTAGSPTIVDYGNTTYPSRAVSAAIGGGAYFCGGGSVASSIMHLDIPMGEMAGRDVTLDLSAYLGGFDNQGDVAQVVALFLGAAGNQLGLLRIGPVTPADRSNITTLLPRSGSAAIPAGTVTVRLRVSFARAGGTVNDGYVDNIRAAFIVA